MLSETELVATCITLLTAGHETTTGLIGNGLLALLRHPDQLRKLQEDPALIGTAVEEFLRFDTSFLRAWRLTAEDVEIGGKQIPRGQTLSLMLGAANRDPAQFEEPDRLDITRDPNLHTSFGWGIHFCAGAPACPPRGRDRVHHAAAPVSTYENWTRRVSNGSRITPFTI